MYNSHKNLNATQYIIFTLKNVLEILYQTVPKPSLRNILQALSIILAPVLHVFHSKNVPQQSTTYKTILILSIPHYQILN